MIRLVLSDLVHNARVWAGVLAVTVASGFVAAFAAALIETGIAHGGRVEEALASSASAVVMFTAVAALVALSSSANLAVALHQRSYALWQVVGVRPALVATVVLSQLALVGIGGALLGCALALPVIGPATAWIFRDWDTLATVPIALGGTGALLVVAALTVVILLGGMRGARRAARVAPVEALREPEPPRARIGWLRLLVGAGLLCGLVAMVRGFDGATFTQISSTSVLLVPLIVAVLACAGPLLLPLVLRAWTALVPARASSSWFLARHEARHRLSRSTAAISPLMVAIALAGGLYSTVATLGAAKAAETGSTAGFDLAPEGVVLMLGGPLLVSAVAAAGTVFMSGQSREHDAALLRAAGATRATVILAAVWEACVYVVTAALLGLLATAAGTSVIARALGLAPPAVSFPVLGAVAGAGLLLLLVATLLPTLSALRRPVPRVLAVE